MVAHKGFRSKKNAERFARGMRNKGYTCSVYRGKKFWNVSVTKK